MQNPTEELYEWHRNHAWMPFTQMQLLGNPPIIESGQGVYLRTRDGREIIDAIGSWWVTIHGHSHPRINAAIKDQLDRLEHVIYAGMTHEPALRLGHRLSALTNHHLPRCFFSDNGSTAVEIGLKMAFQYFLNTGRPEKSEFVCLSGGYHGDTIGAMSVGARSVFHEAFAPLLFDAHQVPAPRVEFRNQTDPDLVSSAIAAPIAKLAELFETRGERICALILEPLIQGASAGFNIYPAEYLRQVRALCDRHNVLLIADEVFTGAGRTGHFFATGRAGVQPDILALSKGLSGGYLPFAVTLATEEIYESFLGTDRRRTLFHGHSMTGSPLGCAAAHASLDVFEEEAVLDRVRELERSHAEHLARLQAGPLGSHIKEVRYMGSVGVVELALEGDYTSEFGWRVHEAALSQGVLLRPLGPSVYLTPPFVIEPGELARAYEVLESSVLAVLGARVPA